MGSPFEMKQACLHLSDSALALFDLIAAKGVDAPLEDYDGIAKLKNVINISEEIRDYYSLRNVQRMLALGITPDNLYKKLKEQE